ncbi:MAG: hypothetical protein R3D68_15275 [Hyphomicrobiaceae bacterium]
MALKLFGAALIVVALLAIRFAARRTATHPMPAMMADAVAVGLTTLVLFGAAFVVFAPG